MNFTPLKDAISGLIVALTPVGDDNDPLPKHGPPLTANNASIALFGHHDKPTIDDLRYWLARFAGERSADDTAALHHRMGWDSIKRIWRPDMEYEPSFDGDISYIRCALLFGLSPQDAWTVGDDGEPTSHYDIDEIRSRWLLYHAESESYVLCNSLEEAAAHFGGPEDLMDTTGHPDHEQQYMERG